MNLAACSCRHKNNPIFVLQLFKGFCCSLCLYICAQSLHCKCWYTRMRGDLVACMEPGHIQSYEKTLPLSHTCTLNHLSALVWQSKEVEKKAAEKLLWFYLHHILWKICFNNFIISARSYKCMNYKLPALHPLKNRKKGIKNIHDITVLKL